MSKLISGFCVALGATLMAAAGGAFGAETTVPKAYIPFASHGGIRDWRADRDQGVWVQDIHRHWYYAKLMAPCIGLNFAQTIGFDTHPLGRFDQFSSIFVPGGSRCAVQSFTVSDAPPSGKAKANANADVDANADANAPANADANANANVKSQGKSEELL